MPTRRRHHHPGSLSATSPYNFACLLGVRARFVPPSPLCLPKPHLSTQMEYPQHGHVPHTYTARENELLSLNEEGPLGIGM